jgi:hypothetical protein
MDPKQTSTGSESIGKCNARDSETAVDAKMATKASRVGN